MKDKLQKITQTFARSIIQPVMFMAVTGLLISVAAVMKLEQLPEGIKNVGAGLFTILTSAAINQLSVIFCVGIAAAIAKKKKTDAAILGITVFLIFIITFGCPKLVNLPKRVNKDYSALGKTLSSVFKLPTWGFFWVSSWAA